MMQAVVESGTRRLEDYSET